MPEKDIPKKAIQLREVNCAGADSVLQPQTYDLTHVCASVTLYEDGSREVGCVKIGHAPYNPGICGWTDQEHKDKLLCPHLRPVKSS